MEYRGPFGAVRTNISGVVFSELMVEQSWIMDKLAIIRSIHHGSANHRNASHLAQTGYYLQNTGNEQNEMPCVGSITAKLKGPNAPGLPRYVSVPSIDGMSPFMSFGRAAYLGAGCNPFVIGGDPNADDFAIKNLTLEGGLNLDRLTARCSLLQAIDDVRRVADSRGVGDAMNHFDREALEMVTSERARKAFDIAGEDPRLRELYGHQHRTESPSGKAPGRSRGHIRYRACKRPLGRPQRDRDSHAEQGTCLRPRRGCSDPGPSPASSGSERPRRGHGRVRPNAAAQRVRIPRAQPLAGRYERPHCGWEPQCRPGNRRLQLQGRIPISSPYRPENVLAMVYRHLGIEPTLTFADFSGRPRHLLENCRLIKELI